MKTSTFFLAVSIGLLFGCSKSSPDPKPDYYVSATIDGKAWMSNVTNSQNTLAAATLSQDLVVIAAGQEANNTNTVIAIAFPKSIPLNKPIAINSTQYSTVAYMLSSNEGYAIDASKGVTGTLTVTRLDETAGIVEGNFSGEGLHNQNGSRISIANGQFRSIIYKTNVTPPSPGKR